MRTNFTLEQLKDSSIELIMIAFCKHNGAEVGAEKFRPIATISIPELIKNINNSELNSISNDTYKLKNIKIDDKRREVIDECIAQAKSLDDKRFGELYDKLAKFTGLIGAKNKDYKKIAECCGIEIVKSEQDVAATSWTERGEQTKGNAAIAGFRK